MKKRILMILTLGLTVASLSSCWPVLVAGGAAGGYIARDKGYKVQSPVENDGGGGSGGGSDQYDVY